MLQQQHFSELAEQLNQARLSRASSLMQPMQQRLFRLIPFLLQHNHQDLPGFINSTVPCGIYDFSMSEELNEDCEIFNFPIPATVPDTPYVFEGLYAMGSLGSFGHSAYSDVDIWVVHKSELGEKQLKSLRKKLDKLSQWFLHYDLEVNFYLVHPYQFRSAEELQSSKVQHLGKEHSGSAQRWLLLEEFYRSQVKLAGRIVAWWPHIKEHPDLLHLGDVRELSPSEYFGASLWHLYKGIEKPHKAFLKVLLLEAYANNYPNPDLLTDKIWQLTYEGNFSVENDAYFVLYDYLETYLLEQQDLRRLDVLRRSFYLKCGFKLSVQTDFPDWRIEKMRQLTKDWNWSDSLIETLDNCRNWHCGQLKWFNAQLSNFMLASYQTLLSFASKHQLDDSLKVGELNVLSRKLHTFFHSNGHQISKLNCLWSNDITEDELGYIQSNRDGDYYLYGHAKIARELLGKSPLCHFKTQAGLLMWACFNKVSVEHTAWYKIGTREPKSSDLTKINKQLIQRIKSMPDASAITKQDLFQPWHYSQIIVLLNLESDPTCEWNGQELMVDVLNANVFSMGRKKQNLLGSIDILTTNSWGEWQCHYFKGELAILDLITFITPGLKRAKDNVSIEVLSCSKRLQNQLEHSVAKLIRNTVRLSSQATDNNTLLQPVHIGERRYGIFIDSHNIACQDLHDPKSFYQRISCDTLTQLPRPTLCDDPMTCAPPVILDYAARNAIQYFLRQRGEDIEVFVLDDANELSHYIQHSQTIEQLVSTTSRHYAFDEITNHKNPFNLPQFFQLERIEGQLQVIPFGMSAEDQLTNF
ncbi:class I adenylate cyclase [Shewanella sp. OPT22]|nr:class I adenylate cyclase [Shewanella sp. OPT22]